MTAQDMALLLNLEASIRENYKHVDQETRVVLDDLDIVRANLEEAKAKITRESAKAPHGQRFKR